MAAMILLDSGPLGLACSPPGFPLVEQCREWLYALEASASVIVIPSICDFEVRRELIRLGAARKLQRLNILRSRFAYADVSQAAWDQSSKYWAYLRKAGLPTAGLAELDVDTVLAGIAATLGDSGDAVVIATMNSGHLDRFPGIEARFWLSIA